MENLFAYVSQNPQVEFDASAPWLFLEKMKGVFSHGDLMRSAGDVFHNRKSPLKPQLNSLLAMATFFRVPLLDILLDPTSAGSQCVMDIAPQLARRKKKRRAIAQERLDRYRQVLEQAIEEGPPYPTHEALAMHADMPPHARPASLENLVRQLHQLRANDVKQRRTQKQTLIDQLVLDHAKIEGSRPRKPFIKKIVSEANAPVHTVRDRVRILCDKVGQ